jgi:lysophospholipase L1-like esterase
MTPPERAPRSGRPPFGWIGVASVSAMVAAWLVLVLHSQYQIAWLGDYAVAADALFLTGVAGIALTRSLERRGSARVGAIALRLGFSMAVIAGALVVSEFAARFVFRDAISSGNAGDFIAHRGGGPRISVNSLGFREREVGPKDPNRYRIAVIGDSFTWGQGIEERDRFSNLLEGFLGSQYEVLNFGRPGNNMPEHLNEIELVLPLRPNFVLLQLYVNDFETPTMKRPETHPLLPSDLDGRLVRSSLLYQLLLGRWAQFQQAVGLSETYTHYMARYLQDPNAPDARAAFGMLRQLIDRARAAGVPIGVVFFPAPDAMGPNGATYPFGYLHDRARAICAEEQIPYLDLLAPFSTFRPPRSMWVSPFDAHPNAKANRRAAFEILREFGPVWHH